MVDANSGYRPQAAEQLRELDEFELLLIEQPLGHDDLLEHARLQARLRTPICLDESIGSAAQAEAALEPGSCRSINIKPARVGGLMESVRIHDLCRDRSVPLWCGGMLETGIGRAHNVALASLPNFTLPGDLSASARYFRQDVIRAPFTLTSRGTLEVPQGPGTGVEVDTKALSRVTTRLEAYPLRGRAVSPAGHLPAGARSFGRA